MAGELHSNKASFTKEKNITSAFRAHIPDSEG
jgi:hypothetical protein